jgi:hypothetical protein
VGLQRNGREQKVISDVPRKHNLLIEARSEYDCFENLTAVKIVSIAEEIRKAVQSAHEPASNKLHSYTASTGLGGSSNERSSLKCRLRRINELARFTLLYSDTVHIANLFDGYWIPHR